jgi:hypothetical protein
MYKGVLVVLKTWHDRFLDKFEDHSPVYTPHEVADRDVCEQKKRTDMT